MAEMNNCTRSTSTKKKEKKAEKNKKHNRLSSKEKPTQVRPQTDKRGQERQTTLQHGCFRLRVVGLRICHRTGRDAQPLFDVESANMLRK